MPVTVDSDTFALSDPTPTQEKFSDERSPASAAADHAVWAGDSGRICPRQVGNGAAAKAHDFLLRISRREGISVKRPSDALSTCALIIIGLAGVTACAESSDVQRPVPASATTSAVPAVSVAPSSISSRSEPPRLPDTEPVAPPPVLEPEAGEPAVPEPPPEAEAPERPAPTLPDPGFAPRPGY